MDDLQRVAEPDELPGRALAALWAGAALWLALLVVGLVVPAGWKWGLPGLYGHINNFMIALWAVGLVAAPLLAGRRALAGRSAAQVYLLANLAVIVASLQPPLSWQNEGLPIVAAVICAAAVLATHPERLGLLRP